MLLEPELGLAPEALGQLVPWHGVAQPAHRRGEKPARPAGSVRDRAVPVRGGGAHQPLRLAGQRLLVEMSGEGCKRVVVDSAGHDAALAAETDEAREGVARGAQRQRQPQILPDRAQPLLPARSRDRIETQRGGEVRAQVLQGLGRDPGLLRRHLPQQNPHPFMRRRLARRIEAEQQAQPPQGRDEVAPARRRKRRVAVNARHQPGESAWRQGRRMAVIAHGQSGGIKHRDLLCVDMV